MFGQVSKATEAPETLPGKGGDAVASSKSVPATPRREARAVPLRRPGAHRAEMSTGRRPPWKWKIGNLRGDLCDRRRSLMLRRAALVLAGLALLGSSALVGGALATPSSGVSAETARGPLVDRPLDVNMKFDTRAKVHLKTKGPIEVAVQRIVAVPGASFGWHSHPGPTIVTVLRGTLTLYHYEDCAHGTDYAAGTSFSNLPWEFHLAKNNSATDELVIYASYFLPVKTPPVAIRIDQPSPGATCPL
jgi:quercetin dioxygenase-like cupin family protein